MTLSCRDLDGWPWGDGDVVLYSAEPPTGRGNTGGLICTPGVEVPASRETPGQWKNGLHRLRREGDMRAEPQGTRLGLEAEGSRPRRVCGDGRQVRTGQPEA